MCVRVCVNGKKCSYGHDSDDGRVQMVISILAADVFGHSLGALRDSMLGQLTRQEETDSSLDLMTADGRLLVVLSKASRLSSNLLRDVGHERVHDVHGLAGDASLWVHMLQDLLFFLSPATLGALTAEAFFWPLAAATLPGIIDRFLPSYKGRVLKI